MRRGLWVVVFVAEAVVKSAQLSHVLGAVALALLFTVLVITEERA
ncbi:MAG: hypothetical protein JWO12_1380 [Frankiales bacterium]|nr:hypothetical protein [Frankiales bacterium]